MKKLFVAAMAFCCAALLNAQVKNYVCIVREQYYPSHIEFLEDLRDSLKKRGYSTYSEYVDSYLKGGFGSGFLYVDKDGKNYIVTNRHVVSQAASASVEFENADGSLTKYEGLKVLITDDDIDLAVLSFEGDAKPFKNGLSLYAGTLTDGQDVVSAGFPGLGGEPVWQFGKGSITNASARIKDMIDPSISTVIQHSAQVDAGNSGGPLLIESKAANGGYAVAGINTWKAVGRESTNFAIPAALITRLIDNSKKALDDNELKAEREAKLKAALSDSSNDFTSIVKFVSYSYTSEEGEDYFDDILRHAPTKVRDRVLTEFAFNPIEGLRYAVAYKLFENYSGQEANDENLSKIIWQKEHGLYRIASTSDLKKDKNKNKSKSSSSKSKKTASKGIPEISWEGFESPYLLAVSAGALIPLNAEVDGKPIDSKSGFNLALSVFPGALGMFGAQVEYQRISFGNVDANAFGVGGVIKLPLNFNMFCISPKAGAGIKLGFDEPKVRQFYWEAGLEAVFDFGINYLRPGIEIAYRTTSNTFTYFDAYSYEPDFTVKSSNLLVRLVAGISFD